ncbi:MAG TPA: FecR domain-containing protein [Cellvibrio sp.]|nr:FecR domain-containing protein [Cellvibrio sp.]
MNRKILRNALEDEAISWLAKINSASLSEQQEKAFFAWLEASPLHQAAYINAEHLWQRGEVLARLPESVKPRSSLLGSWQGMGFALASLAALVLMVSFYFTGGTTHYELQTAVGEQKSLQLADGSRLQLNTNSKLEVSLRRGSRVVTLERGEVFFDVSADAARPFDIITGAGVVRVLGTHFAVRQTAADALVTVIEGRVALGSLSSAQEFVPISVLTANQQLNFQAARAGAVPEKINAASLLAWRNRQLVYKGQSLDQVILDLNRYFPVAIVLSDATIGRREVTAVIKLSDIKTTVQALADSLNLEAEFNSDATQVSLAPASKPH